MTPPLHPGTPGDDERQRLTAGFGARLRRERFEHDPRLTQQALAERAGVHVKTISALERGMRRPSTSMTWRLAKGLRDHELDRVALDVQLQTLAGGSLIRLSPKAHRRRERLAAQMLACGGPKVTVQDGHSFDAYVAELLGVAR